jgi:hypothetical protein
MHSLLANLAQEPSRPPRVLAVDVARGSARTVSRTRSPHRSRGILLLPGVQTPALGTAWAMRDVTHWVQTAWLLIVAIAVTAIWSAADRRRTEYVTLHAWFRLFVRFALVSQMFYYGMAKGAVAVHAALARHAAPADRVHVAVRSALARPSPTWADVSQRRLLRPDAPGEGLQVAHRGAALAAHHADRTTTSAPVRATPSTWSLVFRISGRPPCPFLTSRTPDAHAIVAACACSSLARV